MASTLTTSSNQNIAYHLLEGKKNKPGIVFFGGFMSDMQGTKAIALEDFCKKNNYQYIRFDYLGHGQSSGKFTEGTIGKWKENCLTVLDKLTSGPQIIVGSSMGGWLMLLAALARPERVAALVGIASAPDFTENLIWEEFTEEEKNILMNTGQYLLKSEYGDDPYPITKALIEDGRKHLVLDKELSFKFPVRLIHGKKDEDVPFILSEQLHKKIQCMDKKIQLLEDGDHRMSTPEAIEILCKTIQDLVENQP
jgi:pimeloyl-ACP methyl ester carboxylesterase